MGLELDHVFVFVDAGDVLPGGTASLRLGALGLTPSYTRRHVGQGTANVCYCFDNAYLELLFIVDEAELVRPEVQRNGFVLRSIPAGVGSPFGIAVRGGPPPGDTWDYRIEGFPPGVSVPVSVDSDDPRMPFVFGSPGQAAPMDWTDGRAGERQLAAGFTTLTVERISVPKGRPLGSVVDALQAEGVVGAVERRVQPTMILRLGDAVRLSLPSFERL